MHLLIFLINDFEITFFLMETKGRKGKVKIPEHIWNFYSLFVQYSIYLDES